MSFIAVPAQSPNWLSDIPNWRPRAGNTNTDDVEKKDRGDGEGDLPVAGVDDRSHRGYSRTATYRDPDPDENLRIGIDAHRLACGQSGDKDGREREDHHDQRLLTNTRDDAEMEAEA